jgi:hypothetical protein
MSDMRHAPYSIPAQRLQTAPRAFKKRKSSSMSDMRHAPYSIPAQRLQTAPRAPAAVRRCSASPLPGSAASVFVLLYQQGKYIENLCQGCEGSVTGSVAGCWSK